jgi:hypothetical protein
MDDVRRARWDSFPPISDDAPETKPVANGFKRGMVSFIVPTGEEHGRTTEVFVSLRDDPTLGHRPWESPIGVVTQGLERLERMRMYGDPPPLGAGPDLSRLAESGGPEALRYLASDFGDMSFIESCEATLPADGTEAEHEAEDQRQVQEAAASGGATAALAAEKAAGERRARRARIRREESVAKRTQERRAKRAIEAAADAASKQGLPQHVAVSGP